MDMITLAMAKAYTDSQRIGYVEPGKVLTFSVEDFTEDSVILPSECVKVTDEVIDLTKVKRVELVPGEGEVFVFTEFTVERPYGDDNDIYCELKVDGDVFAVTIRESFSEFQKGTYLIATRKSTLELAETIVPIDQKYLPNTVLDFDALGLTPYVLELADQGGGVKYLNEDEDNVGAIYDKFPTSWDFVAKITMPSDEPEATYVKPVHTAFNDNGFYRAHFDYYIISNSEQLVKFYIRINRYITTGSVHKEIRISVGIST